MPRWNWQDPNWPHFVYSPDLTQDLEPLLLRQSGYSLGLSQGLRSEDQAEIRIQVLTTEAYETSNIEGETLDRESLQSSMRRHFGLQGSHRRRLPREDGVAQMMHDLYRNVESAITHDLLHRWHSMLMQGQHGIQVGAYRTHEDPMEIVSGYIHRPKVHYEAPPSNLVPQEMAAFLSWLERSGPQGAKPLPPLLRASIGHLYFESIHPYEDGNGRIGRALVEKMVSENLRMPALLSLSDVIQQDKKTYYAQLEKASRTLEIDAWIRYFSETILSGLEQTIAYIRFLSKKAVFFERHGAQLNPRQEKVILRLFRAGPEGFKGGLSAQNYMAITQTSASTTTRDLADLVKLGALRSEGERKGTRYFLVL